MTIRSITQGNPYGDTQADLPRLLRRLANSLDELDDVEWLDMTMNEEVNENGPWFKVTVYYVDEPEGEGPT